MKLHSDTAIKYVVLAAALILILRFSFPAHAGTRSELMDEGAEAALSGQEQHDQSRFRGYIGGEINYAGGLATDANYKGRFVPLYRVTYEKWAYVSNIGGFEAGAWLWQTPDRMQKLGVSVQRHPDRTPFDSSERSRASADGVIHAQWRTPSNLIHLSYHKDIGHASNGDAAALTLSRNIIFRQALFDRDCLLVPAVNLEWESSRVVDYYYGVRPDDATPTRPAYIGRETINGSLRLTGFFRINGSWVAFAGAHTAYLGPGISDSPLVKRRVATRAYAGAAWLF